MSGLIKNKKKILVIVIVLLMITVGIFINKSIVKNKESVKERVLGQLQSPDSIVWKKHIDNKFNFEIEYPENWLVFTQYDQELPVISFYPTQKDLETPILPYSNDITHISIYPQGVDEQIILTERIPVRLALQESVNIGEDYILDDGSVWATFLNLKNKPESWKSWGFLWASVAVDNSSYGCKKEDIKVDLEECNNLLGDEIYISGEINNNLREIEEQMLRSFNFK